MHATASSWVEINLRRLDANLAAVREVLGNQSTPAVCAVVKANAYGLGAPIIAHRLAQRGVNMMAVFSIDQARELALSGYAGPILTLGFVDRIERADPLYRTALTGRLHLTVHSLDQLQSLAANAKELGFALPVHLFLDTGMCRAGLSADEFAQALTLLPSLRFLKLAGISSHLASADDSDDFTRAQLDCLEAALLQHRSRIPADVTIHLANTFATLRDRRYHQHMVRVGLCLYGYGPGISDLPITAPILPTVRWSSRIVHLRQFPKGSRVGYNQTTTLTRDSTLAIIPAGYADGYHLAFSNKASVHLPDLNANAPIVGKVNMDQIIVDVTDIPGPAPGAAPGTVKLGTAVDLYSDNPDAACALPRLARLAGSSCYDLLCRINPRVPRTYVK